MIDPNDPLAPPFRDRREKKRGFVVMRSMVLGSATVLVVGLFAVGVTVAYRLGAETGASKTVPLILADAGPTKVRPADPGGMKIPNQDMSVFRDLEKSRPDREPERLMPKAERPVEDLLMTVRPSTVPTPSQKDAQKETSAPAEKALAGKPAQTAKSDAPPPPVARPPRTETLPPPAPPVRGVTDAAPATPYTPPVEKLALADPAPSKQLASAGAYRAQIASVSSAEGARRLWAKMRKAHPDLLGGVTGSFERHDLGPKKGVWHRVLVGPFASADAAKAFCDRAKKQKMGCLIARR